MIIGKISKKGQISIPKKIRDQLELQVGDPVVFKIQSNKVYIEKLLPAESNTLSSDILLESSPLDQDSITFQRKLRDEWR
jgi:AbrB family looped-hinge helix DNA binding protein